MGQAHVQSRLTFTQMQSPQIILLFLGLWQGWRLTSGLGRPSLPFRLMSFGYFVNYVFGASISYQYSPWPPPWDVYAMQIDAGPYFSFVLPFMLILVVFERVASHLIDHSSDNLPSQRTARNVILIAMLAGLIQKVGPTELNFYMYLTSLVGPVIYILSKNGSRPFYLDMWFWLAFLWPLFNTLTTGMFYDLILLAILLTGKLISAKRSSLIRALVLVLVGAQASVIVQQVKPVIRSNQEITWELSKSILIKSFDLNLGSAAMGVVTVRLNQGYILSHVLKTRELNEELNEGGGYVQQLLISAALPRFLMPNKLMAGDAYYFEKHSGLRLVGNTSMALGLIAESTIDFGPEWGLLVFILILFGVLKVYRATKNSEWFLVYFTISIFYIIRPDCDLITALGHLFKCTFVFIGLAILAPRGRLSKGP